MVFFRQLDGFYTGRQLYLCAMSDMTSLEYDILNALYFVEPFDKILEECKGISEPIVADCLKTLISRKKMGNCHAL